jgi:hypothetical protein
MDNLVALIREWHPFGQFVMILVVAAMITLIGLMTFNAIEKFINHTLPVIIRGWPPGYKEDNTEDDEDDK